MQSLRSIQLLRAVAALLIAIGHLDNFADVNHVTRGFSWVGIDLFFVISGFVIAYTVQPHLAEQSYARQFLIKRLLRIYPTYWMLCVLAIPVALWTGYRADLAVENYVKAAFLFPQRIAEQFIPVVWSLHYELLFYGMTALLLAVLGRHFWWGVVVWFAALCAAQFFVIYGPSPQFNWQMFFGSLYQLEFMLGMLTGWLVVTMRYRPSASALRRMAWGGGLVAIAALAWGQWQLEPIQKLGHYSVFEIRVLVLGIAFALMVYGLTMLEKSGARMRIPQSMVRIGDASYVLYLSHDMLYMCLGKSWQLLTGELQDADPLVSYLVFMPIAATVAIVGSVWLSERVERPMIRWLKRRAKPLMLQRNNSAAL